MSDFPDWTTVTQFTIGPGSANVPTVRPGTALSLPFVSGSIASGASFTLPNLPGQVGGRVYNLQGLDVGVTGGGAVAYVQLATDDVDNGTVILADFALPGGGRVVPLWSIAFASLNTFGHAVTLRLINQTGAAQTFVGTLFCDGQ